MNKQIAEKLMIKAQEVAANFSNPDRNKNSNKEIFMVDCIHVLSDNTAALVFDKDTGKKAVAFFYYIDSGAGWWGYFFPKDSHIVGMECFNKVKLDIEKHNFPRNFEDTNGGQKQNI